MFRRSILKKVRFSDTSLGEDVKFLKDCASHGYSIYATSPYNYVYIRRKNKSTHTWQVDDQKFINGGLLLAETDNVLPYVVKKLKPLPITSIGHVNKHIKPTFNY